jgi:hypothetical protein
VCCFCRAAPSNKLRAPVSPATETDFDWNKVGGTPRFLQNDETPSGAGWRFLLQFTAALIAREFGDAAECYGFVSDDGRGVFLWQSH